MKPIEQEKLELEVKQLKKQAEESVWKKNFIQFMPVLPTLIIGSFGLLITCKYNKAVDNTTRIKNEADIQVSKINAGLAYVKLLADTNFKSSDFKQQAKTIIAPSLPSEAAFSIGIDELPGNQFVLDELIRLHENDYQDYLITHLEYHSLKYADTALIKLTKPEFKSDSISAIRKDNLLKYLEKKFLLKGLLEDYILNTKKYKSLNRVYALVNYLDYIYNFHQIDIDDNIPSIVEVNSLEKKIINYLKTSNDDTLKSDISKAAEVVIDQKHFHVNLIPYTGLYFWSSFNIESGESPKMGSLESFIIRHRLVFNRKDKLVDSLKPINKSLFQLISNADFNSIDVRTLGDIQYAYCVAKIDSTIKGLNKPYLNPYQVYQIVKKIHLTLNTPERKIAYARELFAYGDYLIKYNSSDKYNQLNIAKALLDWYENNASAYEKQRLIIRPKEFLMVANNLLHNRKFN